MAPSRRSELMAEIRKAIQEQGGQNAILSNAIAERLGLSTTELESLGVLEARGSLPAGELARRTGLTSGAVTRMIDRLEARGYVRRLGDPEDRRRVLVELAPAARKVAAVFYEPLERESAGLLADYSEKELEVILDFARRAYELGLKHTERIEGMPPRAPPPRRRVNIRGRLLGQTVRIKF